MNSRQISEHSYDLFLQSYVRDALPNMYYVIMFWYPAMHAPPLEGLIYAQDHCTALYSIPTIQTMHEGSEYP